MRGIANAVIPERGSAGSNPALSAQSGTSELSSNSSEVFSCADAEDVIAGRLERELAAVLLMHSDTVNRSKRHQRIVDTIHQDLPGRDRAARQSTQFVITCRWLL